MDQTATSAEASEFCLRVYSHAIRYRVPVFEPLRPRVGLSILTFQTPEHGKLQRFSAYRPHTGCTCHKAATSSTTSSMGLCISTSSRSQFTRRIGKGAISCESQSQRCASFSCYVHWLVSKLGPWAIGHELHRSTSSTMTPFSTYSISIARFF